MVNCFIFDELNEVQDKLWFALIVVDSFEIGVVERVILVNPYFGLSLSVYSYHFLTHLEIPCSLKYTLVALQPAFHYQ